METTRQISEDDGNGRVPDSGSPEGMGKDEQMAIHPEERSSLRHEYRMVQKAGISIYV